MMPPMQLELFYSYSHKDEDLRAELEKHLSMLKRQGVIAAWHDRQIGAGKEWENEINIHLERARITLLLISSDFVSSDYCYDAEMKRAMDRHERGETRVIPVILRPVDWSGAPFAKLQALPTDAKPVTSWSNRDEAFVNIAKGIRAAAEDIGAPSVTLMTATGSIHDPVRLVAMNEAVILRALFNEYQSNSTGLGLHEDELEKLANLKIEEVSLIVKGLEVKGLVQTGEGSDDDLFGFAKLTSFGVKSAGAEPFVNANVPDTREDEDAELGVLDYQIASEAALADLTTHMNRIGQVSEAATPKVTSHVQFIQELRQSGGTASQVRGALSALATDMVDYAKELEAIAPPMHDAWERMVQNTSALIALTQVQSQEDRAAAESLVAVIGGTQSTLETLLSSIADTRAKVGVLHGVSQDLNRAVRRTERALDSLANEIRIGNQYNESISKLVKERLSL